MIYAKVKYKVVKSNFKWNQGRCVFPKEVGEHLGWEDQHVGVIVIKQGDLKDMVEAKAKLEKMLSIAEMEHKIASMKENVEMGQVPDSQVS